MTFTLTIKLGNDAMQTGEQVADLLQDVAVQVSLYDMDVPDGRKLLDDNGNTVGKWEVSE